MLWLLTHCFINGFLQWNQCQGTDSDAAHLNLFLSDYLGPDKWWGQDHQRVQYLQGAHFPQLTRPPYSIWGMQFKNLAILFWRLSWELPRVIGVTFVWAGLHLKQFHFFILFLSLKVYSEIWQGRNALFLVAVGYVHTSSEISLCHSCP